MVLAMAKGRAQAFGPKDEVLGKVLSIASSHPPLKVIAETGTSGP